MSGGGGSQDGQSAERVLAKSKAKMKLSGPVKIKAKVKIKVKAKAAKGEDVDKVASAIRKGFGAASKGTILEK